MNKRKTSCHCVTHRDIECASGSDTLVTTESTFNTAGLFTNDRLGSLHIHSANSGITPPQRSLGSAQYFNAFHVKQQTCSTLWTRRVNTINKSGYFRICVFSLSAVVTYAAHRHRDNAVISLGRCREARH